MTDDLYEAINLDIEFIYTSMKSDGDGTCHWIIANNAKEIKTAESKGPRLEIEGMINYLKWRMVKGEISKAE